MPPRSLHVYGMNGLRSPYAAGATAILFVEKPVNPGVTHED
jgi:hypothetical protein